MSLDRKQKKELRKLAKLFEFEAEYLDSWFFNLFLGRIAIYGKMEIFIRSKEQGHNEPHIHVKYKDIEASFSILTGELLAGEFPGKNQRLIKSWILENSEWLCNEWNELSNGIKVKVKSGAADGAAE